MQFLFLSIASLLLMSVAGAAADLTPMKIKIQVGDKVVSATMRDNPTARDFSSLLPLTLDLKDYASAEKVSDLPKRLTNESAPARSVPISGNIALYAPWGNLVIYYKDDQIGDGVIILGHVDEGLEVLRAPGPLKAIFTLETP